MKLSKNFDLKEFESNDGSSTPFEVTVNLKELAINLQVLRDKIQEPMIINSGYRSPKHNKAIGGAHKFVDGKRVETSQHVLGTAADIKVKGMRPKEIHAIIENLIKEGKMKQGGLGLYSTFVHYDIRGTKARWNG
jgi:uncharacterized protein YcbK (DUF882 family)